METSSLGLNLSQGYLKGLGTAERGKRMGQKAVPMSLNKRKKKYKIIMQARHGYICEIESVMCPSRPPPFLRVVVGMQGVFPTLGAGEQAGLRRLDPKVGGGALDPEPARCQALALAASSGKWGEVPVGPPARGPS